MKLRFGTVKNGWLPAELEAGKDSFKFMISHVPNDFLVELIKALTDLLREPGEREACLEQEPVEVDWRFCRIRDDVTLSLVENPGSSRMKESGTKIFEISGSPLEITLPLWRGLRELRGRELGQSFTAHWRQNWAHPFPDWALDALSEAIEIAKGRTSKRSFA